MGQGDLFTTMLGDKLLRVHGPFVKTDEVQAVVDHLKSQGEPEYLQSVTIEEEESEIFSLGFSDGVMNFMIKPFLLFVEKSINKFYSKTSSNRYNELQE